MIEIKRFREVDETNRSDLKVTVKTGTSAPRVTGCAVLIKLFELVHNSNVNAKIIYTAGGIFELRKAIERR